VINRRLNCRNVFQVISVLGIAVALQSCAPRSPYRTPLPATRPVPPTAGPAQTTPAEPARKALPQEAKIKEQDLKTQEARPASPAKEPARPPATVSEPAAPPLPDDSSLLAKVTPATPPQRAASLRLTEEGRKLLDAGDLTKALNRLEKTIVIDSTNPYGYFYLAKAHYRLGRHKESLGFLDVAESRFAGMPFWLAEVHALRGENFRGLGMLQKAEASYLEALRLNSGNRTAADAIGRLQSEHQATGAR
jgi:TPR repeat